MGRWGEGAASKVACIDDEAEFTNYMAGRTSSVRNSRLLHSEGSPMKSIPERKLDAIIETMVREGIHGVAVDKVIVNRVEYGDDDVIDVSVIYDAETGKLDAGETSQIGRHVWKRLIEMGFSGFPSFSFIAKSEAGHLAAA